MFYYVKTTSGNLVVKTDKKDVLDAINGILEKRDFGSCESFNEISETVSQNDFKDFLLSKVESFAKMMTYQYEFISSDTLSQVFCDGDDVVETSDIVLTFSLDGNVFELFAAFEPDIVTFFISYEDENGVEEAWDLDPFDENNFFTVLKTASKESLSKKVAIYDPAIRFAYSEEGQNVLKKALEIKAKEGEDAFSEFLESDELPQYSHIFVCENEGKFDQKEFNSFQFDNGLKRVCFSLGSKEYSGYVFEAADLYWQASNNSPEASALPLLIDPNDGTDCSFIVYLDPTQDTFEEMRTFFNKLARLDVKSSDLYEKVAIYDFECRRVGSIWFE